MKTKRKVLKGYLEADDVGEFHLWACTEDGWREVRGFEPTNALLPAIAQAHALGYDLIASS